MTKLQLWLSGNWLRRLIRKHRAGKPRPPVYDGPEGYDVDVLP